MWCLGRGLVVDLAMLSWTRWSFPTYRILGFHMQFFVQYDKGVRPVSSSVYIQINLFTRVSPNQLIGLLTNMLPKLACDKRGQKCCLTALRI